MRAGWRYALSAVVSILLLDTIVAVVARASGSTYSVSGIGSLAVYAAVAFLAGRRLSVRLAVAVAMIPAAAASTLGWAIAWAVGPGREPAVVAQPALAAGIVLTVLLMAAGIGLVAGLLGVWAREGGPGDEAPG